MSNDNAPPPIQAVETYLLECSRSNSLIDKSKYQKQGGESNATWINSTDNFQIMKGDQISIEMIALNLAQTTTPMEFTGQNVILEGAEQKKYVDNKVLLEIGYYVNNNQTYSNNLPFFLETGINDQIDTTDPDPDKHFGVNRQNIVPMPDPASIVADEGVYPGYGMGFGSKFWFPTNIGGVAANTFQHPNVNSASYSNSYRVVGFTQSDLITPLPNPIFENDNPYSVVLERLQPGVVNSVPAVTPSSTTSMKAFLEWKDQTLVVPTPGTDKACYGKVGMHMRFENDDGVVEESFYPVVDIRPSTATGFAVGIPGPDPLRVQICFPQDSPSGVIGGMRGTAPTRVGATIVAGRACCFTTPNIRYNDIFRSQGHPSWNQTKTDGVARFTQNRQDSGITDFFTNGIQGGFAAIPNVTLPIDSVILAKQTLNLAYPLTGTAGAEMTFTAGGGIGSYNRLQGTDNLPYIITRCDYMGGKPKANCEHLGRYNTFTPNLKPLTSFVELEATDLLMDATALANKINEKLHQSLPAVGNNSDDINQYQTNVFGFTKRYKKSSQLLPFNNYEGYYPSHAYPVNDRTEAIPQGGFSNLTYLNTQIWNTIDPYFSGGCKQIIPANFQPGFNNINFIGFNSALYLPMDEYLLDREKIGSSYPSFESTYLRTCKSPPDWYGDSCSWNNVIDGNKGVKDIYKAMWGDVFNRIPVWNGNTLLTEEQPPRVIHRGNAARNFNMPVILNTQFQQVQPTADLIPTLGVNGIPPPPLPYFETADFNSTILIKNQMIFTNIYYNAESLKKTEGSLGAEAFIETISTPDIITEYPEVPEQIIPQPDIIENFPAVPASSIIYNYDTEGFSTTLVSTDLNQTPANNSARTINLGSPVYEYYMNFTDDGGASNYTDNNNRSLTFDAGAGNYIWVRFNSFKFEHSTGVMYDRAGMTASDVLTDLPLASANLNTTTAPLLSPLLINSATTSPLNAWSGSYGSSSSTNNFILPSRSDTTPIRGANFAPNVGVWFQIKARYMRFWFYSDGSVQDNGWNMDICVEERTPAVPAYTITTPQPPIIIPAVPAYTETTEVPDYDIARAAVEESEGDGYSYFGEKIDDLIPKQRDLEIYINTFNKTADTYEKQNQDITGWAIEMDLGMTDDYKTTKYTQADLQEPVGVSYVWCKNDLHPPQAAAVNGSYVAGATPELTPTLTSCWFGSGDIYPQNWSTAAQPPAEKKFDWNKNQNVNRPVGRLWIQSRYDPDWRNTSNTGGEKNYPENDYPRIPVSLELDDTLCQYIKPNGDIYADDTWSKENNMGIYPYEYTDVDGETHIFCAFRVAQDYKAVNSTTINSQITNTWRVGQLQWGLRFGYSPSAYDNYAVTPMNPDTKQLNTPETQQYIKTLPDPTPAPDPVKAPLSLIQNCNQYIAIGASNPTFSYDPTKSRMEISQTYKSTQLSPFNSSGSAGTAPAGETPPPDLPELGEKIAMFNDICPDAVYSPPADGIPTTPPPLPPLAPVPKPAPPLMFNPTGGGKEKTQNQRSEESGIFIYKVWLPDENWSAPTDINLFSYWSNNQPDGKKFSTTPVAGFNPLPNYALSDIPTELPVTAETRYELGYKCRDNQDNTERNREEIIKDCVEATDDNWRGCLLSKLGFTKEQLLPVQGRQFNRYSVNGYNNPQPDLITTQNTKPLILNNQSNITLDPAFNINYIETPPAGIISGLPNYGLGFSNNQPVVTNSTDSNLTAINPVESTNSPFFQIYSTICPNNYLDNGTKKAIMFYCMKNYQSGNYSYGYGSTFSHTATKSYNLDQIHTEIRNPITGRLMKVLQPNSVITYKITRPILIAPDPYDPETGQPIDPLTTEPIAQDLELDTDELFNVVPPQQGGAVGNAGFGNIPPAEQEKSYFFNNNNQVVNLQSDAAVALASQNLQGQFAPLNSYIPNPNDETKGERFVTPPEGAVIVAPFNQEIVEEGIIQGIVLEEKTNDKDAKQKEAEATARKRASADRRNAVRRVGRLNESPEQKAIRRAKNRERERARRDEKKQEMPPPQPLPPGAGGDGGGESKEDKPEDQKDKK